MAEHIKKVCDGMLAIGHIKSVLDHIKWVC